MITELTYTCVHTEYACLIAGYFEELYTRVRSLQNATRLSILSLRPWNTKVCRISCDRIYTRASNTDRRCLYSAKPMSTVIFFFYYRGETTQRYIYTLSEREIHERKLQTSCNTNRFLWKTNVIKLSEIVLFVVKLLKTFVFVKIRVVSRVRWKERN